MAPRSRRSTASTETLFPSATKPNIEGAFDVANADLRGRIERSSVWAAYGDALGFASELVDARGLQRRLGTDHVSGLRPWKRKVGGRSGVTVELPPGTYSDDTQLRLATARAIGTNGFDVEAFAKIELAVWPAYSLGGGKGTKAAAAAITRVTSTWFNNPFPGWTSAGGNGAAMRIQPHVWGALSPEPAEYLLDVMHNAMCTHGHPVGLIGAGLHALSMAWSLDRGEAPGPTQILSALDLLRDVPRALSGGLEGGMWRQLWERQAKEDFEDVWQQTLIDTRAATRRIASIKGNGFDAYDECLRALDLYDPAQRGSGVLTALAACWLGWQTQHAEQATLLAANAIGSDTDTIATMAGALLGPGAPDLPPQPIQDQSLIVREARRLASHDRGGRTSSFRYPDLLSWVPPQSQGDVLGIGEGQQLALRGLGDCRTVDEHFDVASDGNYAWQWVETWFGQRLLVKRRRDLPAIRADQLSPRQEAPTNPRVNGGAENVENVTTLTSPTHLQDSRPIHQRPIDRGLSLDTVFQYLDDGPLTDERVGYALTRVARDGSNDDMRQFVGALREMLRRDPLV